MSTRFPLVLAACLLPFAVSAQSAADDSPADADSEPSAEATDLGTIRVTASPFERGADELAQPVDVLYGEALDRRRSGTLGDTLDGRPGISSSDFGPGVGRPVIRGQGGARVLMLENGVSSMDAAAISADHAVSIDPAHAEQIEIIKGPATLLYGSGASAGVINVVNGRIPRQVIPGAHGQADLGYTDNGDLRRAAGDLTVGYRDYVFRADASARESHDVDVPGFADRDGEGEAGHIENSATQSHDGSLTMAWVLPERLLSATVSGMRSRYGVPGHAHNPGAGGADESVSILLEQTRVDLNGEWFGDGRVERSRLRLGVNDYAHQEFEGSELGTRFDNRELELRGELTHAPLAGWRGVFGLQFNDRRFEAVGDEAFVPPVDSRTVGLFWLEERAIGEHRLELGLRGELTRHDARANRARRFRPLSLSAGYVHELGERHHLRVTLTRSQRAPASEELYSFGPHLATDSFERGAVDLGVETANNLELGIDRHRGLWRWQLNLFANRIDDYVFQSEVDEGRNADGSGVGSSDGQADRVDEDGTFRPDGELLLLDYAQADALLYGVEAQTTFRLYNGPRPTELRLFADTVRGRLIDGAPLPRITPARVGTEFVTGIGRWSGALRLVQVFGQDRVSPLETTTGAHTLLSLDLERELAMPGRPVIYLRGRNLLNDEARRHTSFLKDLAPLPGRALSLGVRMDFDL